MQDLTPVFASQQIAGRRNSYDPLRGYVVKQSWLRPVFVLFVSPKLLQYEALQHVFAQLHRCLLAICGGAQGLGVVLNVQYSIV
jgi:hypothetical protein